MHHSLSPVSRILTLSVLAGARTGRWLAVPLATMLALSLASADLAEAKRLGGGSSFGSKPGYSAPKEAPKAPPSQAQKQAAPPQHQTAPAKPSLLGGLGGMVGGLVMGGLIGSLLFGGGGFGGPGLMDVLLLGGVAFLAFKLLRRKRTPEPAFAGAGGGQIHMPSSREEPPVMARQSGGWGSLQGDAPPPAGPALPADVEEGAFLEGAKMLYARLQAAWDRRDLEDIRTFVSPEVHAEIARQAAADPGPGRTEILHVQAQVLEARTQGSETVISVLFDAMLREDRQQERPSQVREVWHFRRDESAARPEWQLEGIQQLA